MPKVKISEFSSTPGNNTDIDGINIAENCAPSGINDAIRELMAQLKDFQQGTAGDSFNGPVGTTTAAAGAFTTLSASGAVTLSGGTANGVAYLNGSKVLTTGSALTFDGTRFIATTGGAFQGSTNPTSGAGLELTYGAIAGAGRVLSYDRTGAARMPLVMDGSYLAGYANGTEGMRLTSTGLGIGTSSPTEKITVAGAISSTSNASNFDQAKATFDYASGAGRIASYASTGGSLLFFTNPNGGSSTERARIDSSGNLLVNATSAVSGEKLFVTTNAAQNIIGARLGASGSNATCFLAGNATGATSFDYFGAYDGTGVKKAGITSAGTFQSATNTYGGTSDERLKENITDATPKLNDLLNVRIRNFNFKSDEQKLKQIGVVAQELETVFPALVEDTPTWNEQGESTGTVKNVKYSVFVPMLIKAIQEQQAIITALTARVTALESN